MIDRTLRADLFTRENIKDVYTLSPMQEGMLFHALLEQDAPTYFQQAAFRTRGSLDVEYVRQALDRLVGRHDALRTIFKYKGVEQPLQIVLKKWEADFVYEDLRRFADEGERETYVRRFKERDRARPFDLFGGALMRLSLLRVADEEYEFVWSHHHILMDGWCLGTLTTEFFEIYNGCRAGLPAVLPPARPYSSYITWLEKRDREAARRFWQTYLKGYDEAAYFPARKGEAEPGSGYRREKFLFTLDEERTGRLRELAASNRATLYQVVQSAWGILLGKYNGTRDVVYGSVVSGRPSEIEGVEQIIGLFINTIPVRVRCEAETPFSAVLEEVKERALSSAEHVYFPLVEIQALSEIKGRLFDHIVVFDNLPGTPRMKENVEEATINVSQVETFEQTNYPLCLDIGSGERLTLAFTFDARMHERSFIERTAGAFAAILDQVSARPDIPFREITIFTESDRAALERFNATECEFARDRSVVEVIEGIAASNPDAPAIIYNGKTTTYGELSARSTLLAQRLRELTRISKDDRIALLLERSDLMVESILAVWKAGAAYVPVDVDYPAARIVGMISDAGAKLTLTESSSVAASLPAQLERVAPVVALDELPARAAKDVGPAPDVPFDAGSLAYVIYTSGSTGRPKGSMIEHLGMLNHLYAKIHDLNLGADSVVVQNASHCFDISVWQFFAPLMVGATAVIYDKSLVLNPSALLERVAKDKATVLEVVPSYLSMLLVLIEEREAGASLQTIRHLLVTGEAVKPALVERWFKLFPRTPLVNAYGPTEASDDITHFLMTQTPATETVPVGRALRNLKIYIADEYMNLCPVGVKGEILVSGVGVGRGYLNDAARTAQSFTEDPFRPERGVRLYKTGDIGRYLESGLIEFFGRKDNQVKIRGFRIELEEIESVIAAHPSVREAVVVEKRAPSGDARLAAYLLTGGDHLPEALRDFIAERLPDYMIPSSFIVLDELPVTTSGKLDRKALGGLPVDEQDETPATDYTAPREETEERLVQLWQEILQVPAVGIRDNFFDLGGDSFKAIRLVSKFGKGFLVPDLYKYPTIEKLVAFIRQNGAAATSFLYKLSAERAAPKYAVIAVPNSAGDPSIYQETAGAFQELSDEYAVYGVVLPRREPEPDETMREVLDRLVTDIVEEIKKRIDVPLILYGQCNGSALTLQLARRLEAERISCHAVCMSAQLPIRKMLAERDERTDEEIVAFLDRLAATYPTSPEDLLIFIRNFRYDGVMARVSYNRCKREIRNKTLEKLKTPLYCIVGQQDPLTRNYKSRYRDWFAYAEQVKLIELPEVGHFIWRDRPAQLAEILFGIGEGSVSLSDTAAADGLLSKIRSLLTSRPRDERSSRASRN
jgi:amino acid adenylation domain-containing protein